MGSLETSREPEGPISTLIRAAPALLVAALVLLPQLNKAYTIDDTVFLWQAKHLLVDPWHPTAFDAVWVDVPQRFSTIMASGPVQAFMLIPAVHLDAEWPAHLLQLLLLAMAVWATTSLALRCGLGPRGAAAAALLVVATPAVVAMAATCMPDIPAMAFGVAGIDRLMAWTARRRIRDAAAATIALTLATLTRSHLLLLLVVGAVLVADQAIFDWRKWVRQRWLDAIPLLFVPALALLTIRTTRDPAAAGADLLAAIRGYFVLQRIQGNLTAYASHWTFCFPLTLPWVAVRWRPLVRGRALWVGLAWFSGVLRPRLTGHWVIITIGASLSVAVLADILSSAWRERDAFKLACGLWLLLAIPIAVYPHLPSKYLTASAPAVAILVVHLLKAEFDAGRRRWAATIVGAAVGLGLTLGILIIHADATMANFDREAVDRLVRPNVERGRRVWFAGHWGFQWYAERAGAQCVTTTPPHPSPRDLIVVSAAAVPPWNALPPRPRLRMLEKMEQPSSAGQIMSAENQAGFFSNGWGDLPWTWHNGIIDRVELYEVN